MKPGDLHWIEFPAGAGRAQAGRRPGMIVQSESASAKLPTVLVVPLTTQLDALRFAGTILIEPDRQNGLRIPSVALVFQLTAIDKRFITHPLGAVSRPVLENVRIALQELTC